MRNRFPVPEKRAGRGGAATLLSGALAAALFAAAPAAVAAPQDAAVEPVTEPTLEDRSIDGAVLGRLLLDEGVPSHKIDVETREGIVTLTGSVDNLLARERAVRIAQTVKGVRAAIDRIAVRPAFRTDAAVRDDVQEALLLDPATESFEVLVTVEDGKATLSGTVESWAEALLAESVAKGVRGVKAVASDLSVRTPDRRPDAEIREEIEARLRNDVTIDHRRIDVAVEDGVVTLSGTVGSAAEKSIARTDALVANVKRVETGDLAVTWWTADDRAAADPIPGDAAVRKAVLDAFLYDPRVLSFKPEVEVEDGTVTLTGTVSNLAARRAAEQDARNTRGVWRVRNYLRVRPVEPATDERVARRVRSALHRDPYVDRYDVTVEVHDGRVFLTGDVLTGFERRQAERAAARVEGAYDVVNMIGTVGTRPERSDWEVREDIRDELFWSPFVDSDRIRVSVEDGVATLEGTVDDWYERTVASQNAREGGARSVINLLAVENGPEAWQP